MNRAFGPYKRQLPRKQSNGLILIGLVALGLLIYFLARRQPSAISGNYSNEERWDIKYSDEGLPLQIVIHRDAKRV